MSPKHPARVEVLWTCLATETDPPNDQGDVAMHFTLRHETGVNFVVSITGNKDQTGTDFVNAMRAAAAALALPLGGSVHGARLFSPSEIN
jgi:hypothetical protein